MDKTVLLWKYKGSKKMRETTSKAGRASVHKAITRKRESKQAASAIFKKKQFLHANI